MESILIASIGTIVVGLGVSTVALVGLVVRIRNVADRLVALGVGYTGMGIIAVGVLLVPLYLIGSARLPFVAAVPAFLLVGFTAIRLRRGALTAFREARLARDADMSPRDIHQR